MAKKSAGSANLEARIRDVISSATDAIVRAVRRDFADEVKRVMAEAAEAGSHRRGRTNGHALSGGRGAIAHHAPRNAHRGDSASTDGAGERVLAVIRENPGLRSEQIMKLAGLASPPVKAALARLRESGHVRTSGVARGTTYTAS